MKRVVTVIQARTGSSRFPAKILKPLLSQTVLYRMVERVLGSARKGEVVVATTDLGEDRIIEKMCEQNGWSCYRGDSMDLLSRHYLAAKKLNADVVVKIPSDCPLIDPLIIDQIIEYFLDNSFDYASNLHPASYPDGNDVEVMSMDALEYSWVTANRDFEREHTTPYMWENRDLFNIGNFTWETGLNYSMSHRFTLDYPEDYKLIQEIYERLYPLNPHFSLEEILALLEAYPHLLEINAQYRGVNWYRKHIHELKSVKPEETSLLD
jgi:spore coat polysaccharide biosynthesis protein SpsF